MKAMIFAVLALEATIGFGQNQPTDIMEATAAVGNGRGTISVSYFHHWRFGRNDKIGAGVGGRLTSFFGSNLYYITAPAILTSGSTGPLVIFKENIAENIDSLVIRAPQVNAVNAAINLEYAMSSTVTVGFNIDAVGFSFGKRRSANYINGATGKMTMADPTAFNILLISDNDRGSLNSEFYGRYKISPSLAIKGGVAFLFTEYTTETPVQESPRENDRFRNKSLLLVLGITVNLHAYE